MLISQKREHYQFVVDKLREFEDRLEVLSKFVADVRKKMTCFGE